MKNWKILLIMLVVFTAFSCNLVEVDSPIVGEKYTISNAHANYLSQVFGSSFVDKYKGRIYIADLQMQGFSDNVIGIYNSSTDKITIDYSIKNNSLTLYLIGHEMTHAYQSKMMGRLLMKETYYYVPIGSNYQLNTEQEAELVGMYIKLHEVSIFTNGTQIVQNRDIPWMEGYMKMYMGFNYGN